MNKRLLAMIAAVILFMSASVILYISHCLDIAYTGQFDGADCNVRLLYDALDLELHKDLGFSMLMIGLAAWAMRRPQPEPQELLLDDGLEEEGY